MIIIPKLRTRRMAVEMRELKLGESIALCRMQPDRPAAAETAFLSMVCEFSRPTDRHVTDPRQLTAQERARLTSHYLSAVSEQADFAIGDAHLSDYLLIDRDLQIDRLALGRVGDMGLVMVPLLGCHLELLERRSQSTGDWLRGMVACQIYAEGEAIPDVAAMPEIEALQWLDTRVQEFESLAESEAEAVVDLFNQGSATLTHFFDLVVDKDGPCFLPAGGSAAKAAGRFRASAAVSQTARDMAG